MLELWMVPLFLLLGMLVQYGMVYGKGQHRWQRLAKRQASTTSSESLDRSVEVPTIIFFHKFRKILNLFAGDRRGVV